MKEKLSILLVRPYLSGFFDLYHPPLGIITLAGQVFERLGREKCQIEILDLNIGKRSEVQFEKILRSMDKSPAIVGFSTLTREDHKTRSLAQVARRIFPDTIIALGGPIAWADPMAKANEGFYDWIFYGEADYSFPNAVDRILLGSTDLTGIPGIIWRQQQEGKRSDRFIDNGAAEFIADLDALAFPAWDLVDLSEYAKLPSMMGYIKGKRYAPLFTSRGCPYKCTYCHDIFGKKFRWRSAENVLAEIELLRSKYGVDELHIVDDIFNLHKPRMKQICQAMKNWNMNIAFPNGIRADILNEESVDLLVSAGTYQVSVAIETVTPRLQEMIQKNLNLEALVDVISWFKQRGVIVNGFFMIGFPTETVDEIENTIQWALRSDLMQAAFSMVVAQQGLPLYDLAKEIDGKALEKLSQGDYFYTSSWYSLAYNVDLSSIQKSAFTRFYFKSFSRLLGNFRALNFRQFTRGVMGIVRIAFANKATT